MIYIDYKICGEMTIVSDGDSLVAAQGMSFVTKVLIETALDPKSLIEGVVLKKGDVVQLIDRQERWSEERTRMWVLVKEA